ncbi:MAG: LptF/LptG family permease, partial [Parabacteroides sp.]|nr:LptF/LptG family permease [Parabacteroides sp.]
MLQTFLPLFFMTFGICLFIVLMQFLWRYIDDMVGKGIEMSVLAEMFIYAALSLVPMALPLAILLASLMTFGNLGERLELLAMKSAGVSLVRIMRPLIITISLISIGAFFFQNKVMPVAQVKLYSLLWSMRQKSPELDIPEGTFYNQITGFNVYVKHKDKDTGLLRDLMIYDFSNGFNNASVIVADSGRLKTSADKMFLVLSLYSGESFANLKNQSKTSGVKSSVPYRRETFGSRDILIEFDANFSRTDESFMQNQFMGKDLHNLQTFIDSMGVHLDSIQTVNAKEMFNNSYKKTLTETHDIHTNRANLAPQEETKNEKT